MSSDGRTTSEQLYIPTLLVVGGCEALVVRCYHAAKNAGLAIRRCDLEEAAATIPRRHPLAIVVPNDVFDAAGRDLVALARDVRSVLLRVDPEVSVREIEAMIAGAVAGGLSQQERRDGAGRYSIVDGIAEEAPFSQRGRRSSVPGEVRQSSPPGELRPSVPPEAPPSARFDARQSLPRSGPPPARVPGLASIRPVPGPVSTRPSVMPASGPVSTRPPSMTPVSGTMASRPSVTPVSGPVSSRSPSMVPVASRPPSATPVSGAVSSRPPSVTPVSSRSPSVTPVSGAVSSRPPSATAVSGPVAVTPVSGAVSSRPPSATAVSGPVAVTPVSGAVSSRPPVMPGAAEPPGSGAQGALDGARVASVGQRSPSGAFSAIRSVFSSR